MTDTASWLWKSTSTWPGYSSGNQNNLGPNGNALSVNPSGYCAVTLHDHNADGLISDSDTGDNTASNGDYVRVDAVNHSVREVAAYTGSSVTINGVTYSNLTMSVLLFDNGTYGVRLMDSSIPTGTNFANVSAVHLGTFNGTEYGAVTVANIDQAFVCFAEGCEIDTETGPLPIEALHVGMRLPTRDHGLQPLRWIGRRRVSGMGKMAPVEIATAALGNTAPLRLSPNHRVLIDDWRAELYFGTEEVLVAVKHLVNDRTIRRRPCAGVTYFHLLFDQHEVILSHGLWTESFHPCAGGLTTAGAETHAEILALFPELDADMRGYGPTARPCLKAHEAALLRAA
jgi:hypothetical protein